MKNLLIIQLFICLNAKATVYYVSSSTGNDINLGTSTDAAWASISKINATSFSAGDQILFKKGDSWNERLNPPTSGTSENPITFGSYGTGVKPTLTGFQSIALSDQGSNIWSGTLTNSVARQNTVLINGSFRAKGRYPNSTYLTTTNAGNTQNRIITSFTGTPDYTGGELFTRGYNWINDVNRISSQSVDTLFLQLPTTYDIDNYSYFVQNLPFLCDAQNEWAYDSTSKLLTVYSTSLPTIQYSTIDTLVNLKKKDYITFDGLHITGANAVGICMDSLSNVIIQNCTIDNTGGSNPQPATMSGLAGAAIRGKKATKITITDDSLLNNLNNGIFIIHDGYVSGSDSNYFANNYIYNTSMIAGLGAGSNGAGIGISYGGNVTKIENNKVINTGYAGILLSGLKDTVYRNRVDSFCIKKEDGGGIYMAENNSTGSLVRSNIITNGIGIIFIAAGIYMDNNVYGVRIDSNTTINTKYYGLFSHITSNITAIDNTIIDSIGIPFATEGGSGASYYYKNIFYSQSASSYAMQYGYASPIGSYRQDSNYYLRPINETNKIRNAITGLTYSTAAAWSAIYGLDVNSYDTPTGITSNLPLIYYNPTLSDSTVYFTGTYKDAKGTLYTNSVTLLPFQSKLLFKSVGTVKTRVGNLIFN